MENLSRRSAIAGMAAVATTGMATAVMGQGAGNQTVAAAEGMDCLCMFQIPNLKTSELSATRSENESRDLVAALVGALVPIIVDEIVKATRSRTVIGSSARAVSVDQISATRGDGQEQRAVRGLFSGSVSAPGVKIGVVIG